MRAFILIAISLFLFVHSYDRGAVVGYAQKYWNTANHNCAQAYTSCSPYSYWEENIADMEATEDSEPTL